MTEASTELAYMIPALPDAQTLSGLPNKLPDRLSINWILRTISSKGSREKGYF